MNTLLVEVEGNQLHIYDRETGFEITCINPGEGAQIEKDVAAFVDHYDGFVRIQEIADILRVNKWEIKDRKGPMIRFAQTAAACRSREELNSLIGNRADFGRIPHKYRKELAERFFNSYVPENVYVRRMENNNDG